MYKEIILDYGSIDNFISKDALDIHLDIYRDNLNKLNDLLIKANYDYSYSMIDINK